MALNDLEPILALYDAELRLSDTVDLPGFRIEREPTITRLIGVTADSGDNCILYSALDGETVDAAIEREIALYRTLGHAFEWKHYQHDGPSDLACRLRAHRFEEREPETVMLLDLSGPLPAAPDLGRMEIRQVGPEGLCDVDAVNRAVWGGRDRAPGPALKLEMAADPDGVLVLVAYDGGLPVAVGWARFHAGSSFASLWGGSTLASHRGLGLYRALVALRAEAARRRGYRYVTVDAGAESRPVLERNAFRHLTVTTPFIRHPVCPARHAARHAG